jgi:hypothetical protein
MTDNAQTHRVFSPSKIHLSKTARAWAKQWGMSDTQMARYLIQQHIERGDAFAGDVGAAPGGDGVHGFPPTEAQDPLAGDVGVAPGGDGVHGFPPDPFSGDVGEAEAAQRLLENNGLPFE